MNHFANAVASARRRVMFTGTGFTLNGFVLPVSSTTGKVKAFRKTPGRSEIGRAALHEKPKRGRLMSSWLRLWVVVYMSVWVLI
jgi:hypothetical protein